MNKIPHIHLGVVDDDSAEVHTFLCFPQLHRRDSSTFVMDSERALFYEKCLIPSLLRVVPAANVPRSHLSALQGDQFPVHWETVRMAGSPLVLEQLGNLLVKIEPAKLTAFLEHLREKLDVNDLFKDWFFVHFTFFKGNQHDPRSADAMSVAWENMREVLLVEEDDEENWQVLIGLRAYKRRNVVIVKESERVALLSTFVPEVDPDVIRSRLKVVPCYNCADASSFTAKVGDLTGSDGVQYIRSSAHYSPESFSIGPFSPNMLYPGARIQKTLRRLRKVVSTARGQVNKDDDSTWIYTCIHLVTSWKAGRTAGSQALDRGHMATIRASDWW